LQGVGFVPQLSDGQRQWLINLWLLDVMNRSFVFGERAVRDFQSLNRPRMLKAPSKVSHLDLRLARLILWKSLISLFRGAGGRVIT
jgi:hypothetical protein